MQSESYGALRETGIWSSLQNREKQGERAAQADAASLRTAAEYGMSPGAGPAWDLGFRVKGGRDGLDAKRVTGGCTFRSWPFGLRCRVWGRPCSEHETIQVWDIQILPKPASET